MAFCKRMLEKLKALFKKISNFFYALFHISPNRDGYTEITSPPVASANNSSLDALHKDADIRSHEEPTNHILKTETEKTPLIEDDLQGEVINISHPEIEPKAAAKQPEVIVSNDKMSFPNNSPTPYMSIENINQPENKEILVPHISLISINQADVSSISSNSHDSKLNESAIHPEPTTHLSIETKEKEIEPKKETLEKIAIDEEKKSDESIEPKIENTNTIKVDEEKKSGELIEEKKDTPTKSENEKNLTTTLSSVTKGSLPKRTASKKISNLADKLGPINLAGFGGPPPKKIIKKSPQESDDSKADEIPNPENGINDDPIITLTRSKSLLNHATKNRATRDRRPRPPSANFLRESGLIKQVDFLQSLEIPNSTDKASTEDESKDSQVDKMKEIS